MESARASRRRRHLPVDVTSSRPLMKSDHRTLHYLYNARSSIQANRSQFLAAVCMALFAIIAWRLNKLWTGNLANEGSIVN
jgi:hypothetical protein